MFETSLVESSGGLRSKSGRYLGITATFNVAIVTAMILFPLLYPEALPPTVLTGTLSAPPVPAAAASPTARVAVRPMRAAAPLDAYIAPSRIPESVLKVSDSPPPVSGSDGISMAGGISDVLGGAVFASGLGAAPLPVKVEPAKPAAPMHVSSGVIAGNKISGAAPVYPAIARAARISGTVLLHALISKTGSIESLSVVSGPEMLRASAVAAVQDWRYRPYLLNGEPTAVETTIIVNFTLGG